MKALRRSIRRSGAFSLVALLLVACWPYGFAGGGLPSHIRTVAILPFDNETASPELQRELFEQMRRTIEGRLGLRDAPESRADAVVRGAITRYEPDVAIGYTADRIVTSARRKLQVTIDVEIVDQTTGKTLWERKGLTGDGEYDESAEASGRRVAIEKIVNDVIEGAQSQW